MHMEFKLNTSITSTNHSALAYDQADAQDVMAHDTTHDTDDDFAPRRNSQGSVVSGLTTKSGSKSALLDVIGLALKRMAHGT
jgi:hypothetical protein